MLPTPGNRIIWYLLSLFNFIPKRERYHSLTRVWYTSMHLQNNQPVSFKVFTLPSLFMCPLLSIVSRPTTKQSEILCVCAVTYLFSVNGLILCHWAPNFMWASLELYLRLLFKVKVNVKMFLFDVGIENNVIVFPS